jgi:hypothetical protein
MEPILLILPLGLSGMLCSCLVAVYIYYYYYHVVSTSTKPKKQKTGKIKAKNPTSTAASTATPMEYTIPEGIKTNCPPNKRGVIGWEHNFRTGKSFMWCADDDGVKSEGIGFKELGNDKLSFLSVPRGMKATIFENINKNGLVRTFEAGEYDLHAMTFENGHKLADRASSIRIEGSPPDAGTGKDEYVISAR